MFKIYKVITGVYEGHIFEGHEITISSFDGKEKTRVYDHETVGRSYPLEDCIVMS